MVQRNFPQCEIYACSGYHAAYMYVESALYSVILWSNMVGVGTTLHLL